MSELWRHTATITCPILLVDEDADINLTSERADAYKIHFSKPTKIEGAPFVNWDHRIQTVYEYNISISFLARKEEALGNACSRIENLASRLSFFCSAPVEIKSYGSCTNAPVKPKPGTTYTVDSLSFDQAWTSGKILVINEPGIQSLGKFLIPDSLIPNGGERIERSIRWLHHSHFASTPIEEFMYLMLSFESLSNLIKEPKTYYWHCPKCEKDIISCPICGSSTSWSGSGNLAMKEFVCSKLKWNEKSWKEIWELRNKVFHGSQDLTFEQQQRIIHYLKPLEEAAIAAVGYLIRGKKSIPSLHGRERGGFFGARLHVEYHMPQKGGPT